MSFNPNIISMAVPNYEPDKIIGIKTGSFSVGAATLVTNPATATDSFTTGFNDTCLFQGIYSLDSGTTWNDFGSYIPDLSTPGFPVLQTTTCRGYITSSGVFTAVGLNWFNLATGISSAKTIQYKVVFFTKIGQGKITPLPTNELLYFTTKYNYHKIFLQNSYLVSTTRYEVVTHGLGYTPKVRAFFTPTTSTSGAEGVYTIPAGSLTTLDWYKCEVTTGTTQVTLSPLFDSSGTAINGTEEYRIYLDA